MRRHLRELCRLRELRHHLPQLRRLPDTLPTSAHPRPPAARRAGPATRTRPRATIVVSMLGGALPAILLSQQPVALRGLPEDGLVGKAARADLSVRVQAGSVRPEDLHARLNGRPLPPQRTSSDGTFRVNLSRVPDGKHALSVLADRIPTPARARREFTVDTQPPRLDVPDQAWASSLTEPVTVGGTVSGATRVTADGEPVEVRDRRFRLRAQNPPATLRVTAADAAGNTTSATTRVGVKHPGMRAVHMTGPAWRSDALRKPTMAMIRQGKIDTVELDIKDESGHVGYDSDVALAGKIGAEKDYYDVEKVVNKLHSMDVRVVGRLVAFQDHTLARAAWKSGRRDRVIQTPGGKPFSGGYGRFAFTNFANEAVRQYNIDLAVDAARHGFDGILFDYIRRPDGDLGSMVFPGLETKPTASITSFMKRSARATHQAGAFLGASVFGVAATRPESIAQNIPQMAKHADYISPMVYPSHWRAGEYGVARPNSQPYKIVKRSLQDFQRAVAGTGAEVIPWLQDFSLGVTYGPGKVRAQIEAARDVGVDSFLLWSPHAEYTPAALQTPQARP